MIRKQLFAVPMSHYYEAKLQHCNDDISPSQSVDSAFRASSSSRHDATTDVQAGDKLPENVLYALSQSK
eukprot:4545905-Pleurochrysis_carterae.AAC.1